MRRFASLLSVVLLAGLSTAGSLAPREQLAHPTPSQHTCNQASPLTAPSVTPFDTTGAGADPTVAGLSCGSADLGLGDGLWYLVLGTGNTMTASTCGAANFDTQIAVFCLSCASPQCVAGNDDFSTCANFTSTVSWETSFGAEYLIYVTGFDSFAGVASGSGELTLTDDGQPAFADVLCFFNEPEEVPVTSPKAMLLTALILTGLAALLFRRLGA